MGRRSTSVGWAMPRTLTIGASLCVTRATPFRRSRVAWHVDIWHVAIWRVAVFVLLRKDLHHSPSYSNRTRALYNDAQWPEHRALCPRHRPTRDVLVLLAAVGRGAPPGLPPPSQPHHQARGAHGLLSSIRRLLGRRRAPKPPGLLQRCVRAVRRTRLLRSPRRATRVLHARYFAYGSGLRITGGRGLHPAGQQQLHPR